MFTREIVYRVIDDERDYQNKLGPDRSDGVDRTVGDYVTMLSYYVDKAKADWVNNPGNIEALHQIRKVAAIAIKCMEEHGAPTRPRTPSE